MAFIKVPKNRCACASWTRKLRGVTISARNRFVRVMIMQPWGKRSHQGKWDRVEFSIVTVGPNTDTRLGDDHPGEGMCQCGPEAVPAPLPCLLLPWWQHLQEFLKSIKRTSKQSVSKGALFIFKCMCVHLRTFTGTMCVKVPAEARRHWPPGRVTQPVLHRCVGAGTWTPVLA